MKRGLTTANAIIVAVIVIGSIFAINLFSSLSGVDNISGDVVSKIGGFCGINRIGLISYCPSGSICTNRKCVATPEIVEQTLTIQQKRDMLQTLNKCENVIVGDDDHYVDYNTFGNPNAGQGVLGTGVCNEVCYMKGICISATAMFFSINPDDKDIVTLPKACGSQYYEYKPFDFTEGYNPAAICTCCPATA